MFHFPLIERKPTWFKFFLYCEKNYLSTPEEREKMELEEMRIRGELEERLEKEKEKKLKKKKKVNL